MRQSTLSVARSPVAACKNFSAVSPRSDAQLRDLLLCAVLVHEDAVVALRERVGHDKKRTAASVRTVFGAAIMRRIAPERVAPAGRHLDSAS